TLSVQRGHLSPVEFSHDPQGRIVGVTQDDGSTTRSLALVYDAQGFVAQRIDPIGRVTQYERDAVGRVVRQIFPDLREVTFSYDDAGNLTSVTPPSRPAHGFSYDAVNQVTSYVPPTVPDVAVPTTTYAYNLDGQVELVTRPGGAQIDLVYGPTTGQLEQLVTPDGTYGFLYDAAGRLETMTDPAGGSLAYTYDGSLVLSETLTGDVNGTVAWSYDNNFRVTSEAVDGASVDFAYDSDGYLVQAGAETLARDVATGQLSATALGTVTSALTYSASGALSAVEYDANGDPVYAMTLSRDTVGRIKTKTEVLD